MRVIDIDALPSSYEPPNVMAKKWKAMLAISMLGVPGIIERYDSVILQVPPMKN